MAKACAPRVLVGVYADGGIIVGAPTLLVPFRETPVSVRGSIGTMMAASLVSRGLGFIKAILLVRAIGGTSAVVGGQTFEVANSAPTYLFALVAGGVLGAVLVPQMVRNLNNGPAGQEHTDRLLTVVLVGGPSPPSS
jgi:putative peptidoglycan lipid II flippase